jgi:hypothetical protein
VFLVHHNITIISCDDVQIVRGAENVPITIGGITVPSTARLNLQVTNNTYAPLAYIPIINVKSGNGLFFMHTLSFAAGNLNTLEGTTLIIPNAGSACTASRWLRFLAGCYHAYTPYNTSYPGLLMSTGTEDYFDSVRLKHCIMCMFCVVNV